MLRKFRTFREVRAVRRYIRKVMDVIAENPPVDGSLSIGMSCSTGWIILLRLDDVLIGCIVRNGDGWRADHRSEVWSMEADIGSAIYWALVQERDWRDGERVS